MDPFSLLVKPAGADCNFRCDYCFYLEKEQLYPNTEKLRMSEDVLEAMVRSYMTTPQPSYSFGWQGGEPLLMGLEFFRKATEFQQKYGRSGASVSNGVQTNAALIDAPTARHFARYNYLVGCSLDGPASVHDYYRHTVNGGPTHSMVMQGINHLREHGVDFNILVLVSRANVDQAREVYQYLCDHGFYHQQYIPCVEYDEKGNLLPYAINGEEWGKFKCELFDQWYPDDVYKVSIRHFDAILQKLVDGQYAMCNMSKSCNQYFVVEHNGDIYPCDFFVEPALKLGNVTRTGWTEAQTSPIYRDFGANKARWNEACDSCPHLDLCHGDCVKNRPGGAQSPTELSVLCPGIRMFYDHTRTHFGELAEVVRQNRMQAAQPPPQQSPRQRGKVGRNDPCPCGSGKKYKKCCAAS